MRLRRKSSLRLQRGSKKLLIKTKLPSTKNNNNKNNSDNNNNNNKGKYKELCLIKPSNKELKSLDHKKIKLLKFASMTTVNQITHRNNNRQDLQHFNHINYWEKARSVKFIQ